MQYTTKMQYVFANGLGNIVGAVCCINDITVFRSKFTANPHFKDSEKW